MADEISFEFEGVEDVVRAGLGVGQKVTDGLAPALYKEGEELRTDSLPLVPVDTGALRGTAFVSLIEGENEVSVVVGYGGPAGAGVAVSSESKVSTKTGKTIVTRKDSSGKKLASYDVGYAVFVHENLEAHHEVGQAKYLEQPYNERKPGMQSRIATRIMQNF